MNFLRLSPLLLLLTSISPILAQPSVGGVSLGDSLEAVLALGYHQVEQQGEDGVEIRKFELPNGNELSVTFARGGAIWIEEDWAGNPEESTSSVGKLQFGSTSLGDIREGLGSNGFAFNKEPFIQDESSVATFNSYELTDQPDSVISFVTRARKLDDTDPPPDFSVEKAFLLNALILARTSFAELMWGNDKVFATDYEAIPWSTVETLAAEPEADTLNARE